MYAGTMHGYCLDLLQRRVPQAFKFSVLTEIPYRSVVTPAHHLAQGELRCFEVVLSNSVAPTGMSERVLTGA